MQQYRFLSPWAMKASDSLMGYYTDRYLKIDPVVLDRHPAPVDGHSYMLYMHVPFCHTLCSYCTFHKFIFKEYKAREYFEYLRTEMRLAHDMGYDFTSLYVGGGTTTILEDELIATLELARKLFPHMKEVSCETDPAHLATESFRNLKGLVDRMSIGVQSFDDRILRLIGRYEKFGSGQEIYERIARAQELFPICNVDMIFGFKGQTRAMLEKDVEILCELNPRQITTYPLMVTHQTRASVKDVIAAPAADLAGQYGVILDTLGTRYNQLTSWTFGRTHDEGFDEYVVDHDEYMGIGSGAFSFLDNTLYVNTFSLRRYGERIRAGKTGVERKRTFAKPAVLQYRLLLGLFAARLSRKYFRETYGVNVDRALFKEMAGLKMLGAIRNDPDDPDRIVVTEKGKFLALVMMKDFYCGMDNVRAALRKPLVEDDM